MIGGIVFASSTLTSTPTDSYGTTASATVNETASMIEGLTSTGISAGAGLLLVFAVLGVLTGIGLLRHYAG